MGQAVNVEKAYPGIKCTTVIGQPVYEMICNLSAANGYSVAQTLRILIRMGIEQLDKEYKHGTTSPDLSTDGS